MSAAEPSASTPEQVVETRSGWPMLALNIVLIASGALGTILTVVAAEQLGRDALLWLLVPNPPLPKCGDPALRGTLCPAAESSTGFDPLRRVPRNREQDWFLLGQPLLFAPRHEGLAPDAELRRRAAQGQRTSAETRSRSRRSSYGR